MLLAFCIGILGVATSAMTPLLSSRWGAAVGCPEHLRDTLEKVVNSYPPECLEEPVTSEVYIVGTDGHLARQIGPNGPQGEVYTKVQPCSASRSTLVCKVHAGLQDGQSVPTVSIASVATRG